MTTQEKLEAFAPYYPHELKVITYIHNIYTVSFDIDVDVEKCVSPQDVVKFNLKPILRPLSDLTKPCLEGGKVPIVELAKMAGFKPVKKNITGINGEFCFVDICTYHYNIQDKFSFFIDTKVFRTVLNGYGCFNQLQLFQQLYKWHFWLGDQSEFGKSIIDINTIKK